jgi:hypothetical protein
MGGVDFKYIVRSVQQGATQYSETFNRADQPFFLGTNWNTQVAQSSNIAGVDIAAGVNVGAGFATIGGAAALAPRLLMTPCFVDRQRITSLSNISRGEFSQFTVKNVVAGISGDIGLMVYNPSPNDSNCYMLLLGTSTGIARLFRDIGGGATQLVANALTYVVNDVIRLEITPGVASNELRSYKNGVLQNTFTDNNALRPTGGGLYGLAWFSNGPGGSLSFGDYSGGLI